MRKKLILSAAIFVVFAAGFFFKPLSVYAAESPTMLAFGDSITNGYGVGRENSYVKLFADENGFNLTNYAVDGLKSGGLKTILDGCLSDTEKTAEIKNAKLIMVCIGANDILSVVGEEFDGLSQTPTPTNINALTERLSSAEVRIKLQDAVDAFAVMFQEIIAELSALNDNIVAMTVYNPYSGIIIENPARGINRFNLGLMTELWIEKINAIIKAQPSIKIFDLYRAFEEYTGTEKLVVADFNLASINTDPHPTLKGQSYIYETLNAFYHTPSAPPETPKFPVWAIVLISVFGALFIAAVVLAIIKREEVRKFIKRIKRKLV
ncbi:MAG: GDSL-type esterase/lipase family protein [Clostridiales bacterium]|jgi:lysophospholipase L1-like esterase|nr:GDSL-type esterase/lipase family protein [Clostridiales bacterium]